MNITSSDERCISNSPFGLQKDTEFMQKALVLAKKAASCNEVPIGAIIIDKEGQVLAKAYNQVEHRKCQTAHAEQLAIKKATRKRKDWRLDGCWLYVTLEPCAMCMGLIRLSRIVGVVYGAESPLFGYRLDNKAGYPVYKSDILLVSRGVADQESASLLKGFFKQKRNTKSVKAKN